MIDKVKSEYKSVSFDTFESENEVCYILLNFIWLCYADYGLLILLIQGVVSEEFKAYNF